jgi:hypothetical protein
LTIKKIPDKSLHTSHDLARWVKELRLPASATATCPNFRLDKDRSSRAIDQAHEAWRYGVVIHQNDEPLLVDWLRRIQNWIQENMSR